MKVYIEYKLFILLSFLCIYFSSSASPYIVRSLQNPKCRTNNCSEVAFTHLVKDESTGNLYIGATNSLYKVSPNLTIDVSNETGPKEDNPECFYPQDRSCTNKRLEPSYVKVLVIDPKNSTLIHCTSLFQGSCEKRMLSNLTVTFTTSKPIVANNRTATTVAFIAPGPSESLPRPDAFYVGVSWTRTGLGAARALVPAVSSRRLTDFEFVYKGISVNSFKKIDDLNKETFPVRYIYGFSSEGFSYMATVQKKDAKSDNYISKLIRVCQNDSKFYSYAELELRCSHNGAVYNLLKVAHIGKPSQKLAEVINIPRSEEVLFAMFMIGSNPQFDPQRQESVMCIYKMRDIRRIFTKNIKSCFEGIGNTGPDYLAQPTNCKQSALKENIDDDYCGLYDINTPIDGPDLVEANGAMTLNSTATSLVVTITNKYTVAFVGTDKGHIHKVAIESDRQAYPYEDVTIEQGRAIQKDKYFDADQSNLYVLTDNKLHKMIVQNCSQYTSCATCRGAKDPYCGWCSLENKCSLARDCNNYSEDLRWLGYSGKSCSKVQQVYPDKIQKDNKLSKTTTLTLNISNLPSYTGVYKCSFDGLMTPATRKPGTNVITCDTPSPNEIKPFPTGSDHIVMKLSVIMMDREFVSTNFTIFDCEIHSQDSGDGNGAGVGVISLVSRPYVFLPVFGLWRAIVQGLWQ
ncbi:hypothetical protein FSP39_019830 [Pinctada imbricata]|uniref:Sema domain-containing protein n=1 Tax=Pinctada imbricata TaxID=66713 RepID=A0AA88YP16_PINIB|nr:hypothetical protein FSP39_019830 [Pinctada imbricata]